MLGSLAGLPDCVCALVRVICVGAEVPRNLGYVHCHPSMLATEDGIYTRYTRLSSQEINTLT